MSASQRKVAEVEILASEELMQEITFEITGEAPFVMHNAQLVDPLNFYAKEIKRISSKRKKVEADQEEMSRLEFMGGLYLTQDEKAVPCLTGDILEATLVTAGRTRKLGKQVQSAVFVQGDFPLVYDGPTDKDELWKEKQFRMRRAARVGAARIMRTRPCFKKWSTTATVSFFESDIDARTIEELMAIAGDVAGFGDWRPRYGRFSALRV